MGTSTLVSSVLRDWNERNRSLDKVDKTQNKEETKKNWEKAKKGINEDARQTVEKDTEERFEGQEFNNDNVVKKEKKVEDGFAEVDEDVYTENKEILSMKKEMYAKDEDMYAKESEEMYAKNEEIYAKSKESCFCWPPSGPSQSKSKQMPKEMIGLLGSKHQPNNSLHKAGGKA